jgi:nitroimidazol reductase NimA-like FMN-containing flavoprotein (pyridoxamine 5'-phosphate oxidase superfamily)
VTKSPQFFELTKEQGRALLRRHNVGRLAFTFRDRVDIQPIGYLLSGPWLYGRTSHGSKLVQLKHNPWVAFEVDEIDGPFDWQSVVVHGAVYFLNPRGEEHPDFARAVRLFRRLDPRVMSEADPAPHRSNFFRINIDPITGRGASTRRRKAARK